MILQPPLYLASASPRRKALLELLGCPFKVVVPDIVEQRKEQESPTEYVARLSQEKAQAGYQAVCSVDPMFTPIVIGSDTVVVCDEVVLEKPVNETHCREMLRQLSARSHAVMTAVTVTNGQRVETEVVTTQVWFKHVTDEEIAQYWQSGEPCDKAGSYGIQGQGGRFVTRIEGSYHAVVGLPLYEMDLLLHKFYKI